MPFPVIRETLQSIGQAQATILSVLDLKEAFHFLNLSKRCQEYYGITGYNGGKLYRYFKLPMGLSLSRATFQQHINTIHHALQMIFPSVSWMT